MSYEEMEEKALADIKKRHESWFVSLRASKRNKRPFYTESVLTRNINKQ